MRKRINILKIFFLFFINIIIITSTGCNFYPKDNLTFLQLYKNMEYMRPISKIQNINKHTLNEYNITTYNKEIYPMNEKTFKLYENLIFNYVDNGWVTVWSWIKDGKFKTYDVVTDKLWAQGFYGIFLGLEYKKTHSKKIKLLMQNFVDSIYLMLEKTNGIFLRDNTKDTYIKYFDKHITSLEASKDQMIGLVTALFMIYYYLDNDKDYQLKQKIKKLFSYLNNYFNKYFYILYNPNEKRLYNSAWYLQLHYYGFKYAFDYVLGKNRSININAERLNLELSGFSKFKILLIKKDIITKKFKIFGFISPWKTPILKKLQMFTPNEYDINLKFFEYIIVSTVSKEEALKILKVLENKEVRGLKHLNLAALYLYIIRKWGIKGNYENYYKKVLKRDIYYFPQNIPPNSLKIGSYWINTKSEYLFDPMNHQCVDRTFSLEFAQEWDISPPPTNKNLEFLLQESYKRKINIFNGLFLLTRYNLYSY